MNFNLLLFCFFFIISAYGSLPYGELPDLPGIDFVGFGYDIRYEDAQSALQVPILNFGFKNEKRYSYPPYPDPGYRVPDEVFVRTVAYTETKTYLLSSTTELKEKLSSELGIEGGSESFSNVTTGVLIEKTGSDGNSTVSNFTTLSTDISEKIFQYSTTTNATMETLNKREVYIVENKESTQMFNVFLDTRFIRHEVKEELAKLSQTSLEENIQGYFKFIEKYGTHYVISATLGGAVSMSSIIDRKVETVSNTDTDKRKTVDVPAITRQEALNQATKEFSQQLSNTVDFNTQKVTTSVTISSTSDWVLAGGDSNLVNLLDSSNSAETIYTWKQTIPSNPVIVKFRLREMSSLYDDPFLRQNMATAIRLYLTLERTDDVIAVRYAPVANAQAK